MVANIPRMGQAKRHAVSTGNLRVAAKVQERSNVGGHVLRSPHRLGGLGMGDGVGHKQQTCGKQSFFSACICFVGTNVKRLKAMAEAKGLIFFLDLFGVPIYLWTLLTSIGDVRAVVLTVLAMIYAVIRVVFMAIKNYQEAKLRQLDIREREIEVDHLDDGTA